MKYLILSDLHLNLDCSSTKIELLQKLFSKYNNIIIVGDLFEAYEVDPKEVVNQYTELFSLLFSKNSTLIVGNHDKRNFSSIDSKIKVVEKLNIELGSKSYLFIHGHIQIKSIDVLMRLDLLPIFITKYLLIYHKLKVHAIEDDLIKKTQTADFLKGYNHKILAMLEEDYPGYYYFFGHTHYREITKEYANAGYIGDKFASYIVLSQENIELHEINIK